VTRVLRLAALLPPALLLPALLGCETREEPPAIEFRVPVNVRDVKTGSVEDRIDAAGTLRAVKTVTLRAGTSGILRISEGPGGRKLTEGDVVQAGQTIAEIIGEEVRLAARAEASRQRYEIAKSDYESKQQLLAKGLIADLELRRAKTELAEAKLEWERSQYTEARSRLVTPISGVILRLGRDEKSQLLAEGQLVPQNYEVAQLALTDRLVAEVHLVGPDVPRVRVGQKARIRYQAWEQEDFTGRVTRMAPALDPGTRTLRTEIEIDNHHNLLRPGMFVEATIVAERRDNVPVVPREAVTERGGRKVVFVLDGQRVNRREIVLGFGDEDLVEVREGLTPGDRIVVKGLETLTDGTRVRVTGS
jgi:RND family efflux transporter MFP subunit